MISFKQYLLEDPLNDLALEMALRKELGISQEQATNVLFWLLHSAECSRAQQQEAYNLVIGFRNKRVHDGHASWRNESNFAWMHEFLLTKYDLNLKESKQSLEILSQEDRVRALAKMLDKDFNAKYYISPTGKILRVEVYFHNTTTFSLPGWPIYVYPHGNGWRLSCDDRRWKKIAKDEQGVIKILQGLSRSLKESQDNDDVALIWVIAAKAMKKDTVLKFSGVIKTSLPTPRLIDGEITTVNTRGKYVEIYCAREFYYVKMSPDDDDRFTLNRDKQTGFLTVVRLEK